MERHGRSVEPLEITRATDIDATLAAAAQKQPGALLVFIDEVTDAALRWWAHFALQGPIAVTSALWKPPRNGSQ